MPIQVEALKKQIADEKDLAKRGLGFAMPCKSLDANDIDIVMKEFDEAADRARNGEGPSYLVANTYRFRGHSMSDPMKYRRDAEGKWLPEVEKARQHDPIPLYENRLRKGGLIDDATINEYDEQIQRIVEDAVQFAESSPHPETSDMFNDILAEQYPLEK